MQVIFVQTFLFVYFVSWLFSCKKFLGKFILKKVFCWLLFFEICMTAFSLFPHDFLNTTAFFVGNLSFAFSE